MASDVWLTVRRNSAWIRKPTRCHFCTLYFSSNSCSTCFGQPCAHHQELSTAWCYRLVLVLCCNNAWFYSDMSLCEWAVFGYVGCWRWWFHCCVLMGTWLPDTFWTTSRREIKSTKVTSSWFSYPHIQWHVVHIDNNKLGQNFTVKTCWNAISW